MDRCALGVGTLGLVFGMVLVAGCTSVLGIDGDYVVGLREDAGVGAGSGAGGLGSGGSGDTGGTSSASGGTGASSSGGTSSGATGGTSASSGGTGGATDGCTADSQCTTGTKCCSGACVEPQPLFGCSATGCTRCPAPPDQGVAVCNGEACGIQCNSGYVLNGNLCEPSGSGGAGGTGTGGQSGTGGSACVATKCPTSKCSVAGPFPCCKHDSTCGCTWAPGAICY